MQPKGSGNGAAKAISVCGQGLAGAHFAGAWETVMSDMISDNEGFKASGLDTDSVTPGGGTQRDLWRRFYKGQWEARQSFIEERLAEGETNVMRLIGLLDKFERKHVFKQTHRINDGIHTVSVAPLRETFDEDLTPAGLPPFRRTSLRGQWLNIPRHTPDGYVPFIADVIDEIGPVDAIVELGCGFGRNLFSLYHAGAPRGIPYFGGELSDSAVTVGNRLGRLLPEARISLHAFDHLSPDLSFLPKVEHLFVFTVHTIEQVQEIGQAFFQAVAAAASRVSVLHLEPFGYQVQELGPATAAQRENFAANRWNRNLWKAMEQARNAGTLILDFAALELFFSADASNPTSVALWRNR